MTTPQGIALSKYNTEVVKGFEELIQMRDKLHCDIRATEEEKLRIERDIIMLQNRLATVTHDLHKKIDCRNAYDQCISESEQNYIKILEKSQSLLSTLKKQGITISQQVPSNAKFFTH